MTFRRKRADGRKGATKPSPELWARMEAAGRAGEDPAVMGMLAAEARREDEDREWNATPIDVPEEGDR